MVDAKFISELARRDWHSETELMIEQAVKDAANLLDRNLAFEGAKLELDDQWHVGIREDDTGDLLSVVFAKPLNGNQEWYTQEIVNQLES